jgi:lipopolysaccharide assembly protein B
MMMEWLLLLLPVAAASGWWVARRGQASRKAQVTVQDAAFLRGLNYLLDQRPDKAIDVFLRLAEVDDETAEIHLALGGLFRRRGEVERAIRIHQNLVARPGLDQAQRGFALYELAQDYMRAGLFDRAESLLLELAEIEPQERRAFRALIEIYQQEKDWGNALAIAERLQRLTARPMAAEIAHYRCELAEEALRAGNLEEASTQLTAAQAIHPQCVRALMLQARIALGRGDTGGAATLCRRVAEQGPEFIPDILPQYLEALGGVGGPQTRIQLQRLYSAHPSPALTLALADAIAAEQGTAAAADLLVRHLGEYADLAALKSLLELQPAIDDDAGAGVAAALQVVRRVHGAQDAYRCEQCGYVARHLHWQCPGCKHWATIKATQPLPMTPIPDSPPSAPVSIPTDDSRVARQPFGSTLT